MIDFQNKVLTAQLKHADAMIEKHKINKSKRICYINFMKSDIVDDDSEDYNWYRGYQDEYPRYD